LRSVSGNEGLLSSSFFFLQDVDVGFDVCVDTEGTRLADDLSSEDVISLEGSQEKTNVVSSLGEFHLLSEGFNTGNGGLGDLGRVSDEINILTDLDFTGFDSTSNDSTSTLES
jgi:hypothetical protein